MKIERFELTVRDLSDGYRDLGEGGVTGYSGKLNIRPAYQREFVYGYKERDAVISSIVKGFPLGTMYWAEGANGNFELLDGQQRTISVCQFVNNEFSVEFTKGQPMYFRNIADTELGKRILDYTLFVYICRDGDRNERYNWFRTINIAGVKLTDQELLNANYTGPWLESAKRFFSKTNCPAYIMAKQFVKGSPIRQDFLETALDWISDGNISDYMARHQNDPDASELQGHFTKVIDWVKELFPKRFYRKEMLGLDWGKMYSLYSTRQYDVDYLNDRIQTLMANDEVTDKKGVYEYVLSGEDEDKARLLSKRTFLEVDRRTVYERQNGVCPICGERHPFEEMDGDHIVPWWRGGKTVLNNLQMLCRKCNSGKGGKMQPQKR
jgi:hypothetical protein